MSGFQVLLDDKQSKELQQFIFTLAQESISKAVQNVGLDKDFLNQKEMSDWLGVSPNTLKIYVQEGMPIITMGGRKFYSKKEVTKFMLSKQRGGLDA